MPDGTEILEVRVTPPYRPKSVLNVGDKLSNGSTVTDVKYARKNPASTPQPPEKEVDCPTWLAWALVVSLIFVALKLLL